MGFIPFTFVDFIDIILVASLLYAFYRAMRGTSAPYIMLGIFFIYLLWILVKTFNLVLFSTILGQIISVGVIAIIIIFQPEIRHFLQAIGRQRERFQWLSRIFNLRNRKAEQDINLQPIVDACREMGEQKVGALIIIKQSNDLGIVEESGIAIDAKVSTALIKMSSLRMLRFTMAVWSSVAIGLSLLSACFLSLAKMFLRPMACATVLLWV